MDNKGSKRTIKLLEEQLNEEFKNREDPNETAEEFIERKLKWIHKELGYPDVEALEIKWKQP